MKLRDKLTCIEIRQWLGIEDIVQVIKRNIMRLYGHVIKKDDDDWVKKCVTLEVEGAKEIGPGKRGKSCGRGCK